MRRRLFFSYKAADLVWRHCSAVVRTLPEVFILGATKAGSTSLTSMLFSHPLHVGAFAKELMYLQKLPNFKSAWEWNPYVALLWGRVSNGHAQYCLGGYRKFFPLKLQMTLRAALKGRAITSDCDPFNLYCPTALERIKGFARDPRFVISLRNPIDRAYSDYNMNTKRITPLDRRSFEQAIDDELSGRETRFRRRYLNQSVYEPNVRRWIEAFGRERVLILKAENIFKNPAGAASEMFAFLGLPDTSADADVSQKNIGEYAAPLSPQTRTRLAEYFAPHNDRLGDLIGWKHDLQ
jgi:hypothetical protein